MDFSNFICSPLINGGCGLGKTTALTDPRMYELFRKKLNKNEPQILIIESRSATRDQLRKKNENPNYTFDFILKYCRENKIVKFIRHKATKKEVSKNPNLIYRKEYLQIKI